VSIHVCQVSSGLSRFGRGRSAARAFTSGLHANQTWVSSISLFRERFVAVMK
jgi:hypothetical protein